jgi:uncharacterized protein (DUF488 family)
MSAVTLYTIGHGNRSMEELASLLTDQSIRTLVDVRAQPYSDRFPHFSEGPLRRAMEELEIVYHWAGRQLGGHRAPRPDSPHRTLEEGLRGYADYMETDFFQQSAAQLVNLAAKSPTAILCAEISPQRCHRRLIADYLVLRGEEVIHLIAVGDAHVHHLSPEARRESAQLIYDRHQSAELPFESEKRGGR